ncbi:MAG: type II secretion system F family protein [Candidatus Diapherotrites archaeon]|uniref:Type II secretion system F family protein n=1 Tax=Candidatus Iainarchaeum sp. TaxID=3101447 RepID=A0A8T4C6X4_9ARCH|nr:type II secretion system F family protein [Candidatus Diapherotrites archaeon]
MPGEDFTGIRSRIEEKKKKFSSNTEENSPVDFSDREIDSIVDRMKSKYRSEGLEFNEVEGKLGELKGIISGSAQQGVQVQGVEALRDGRSPYARVLGHLYFALHGLFERIGAFIESLPQTKTLNYFLYSANMPYSPKQWIAMVSVVSILVLIAAFSLGEFFFLFLRYIAQQRQLELSPLVVALSYIIPIFGAFFLMLLSILVGFLIPQTNAQKRGDECSTELPFALRHMATELRAGIGLYKTLQTIAKADYGVLSQEFARTIGEIEEGTDTRDALRHFAARTQSKPLSNALRHIMRALRTGGNLSEIMGTIASDVSFDLRMRVRDYSEKLNFFGVIFIFAGIVMPVFVGVMAAIVNGGLPLGITIPLSPPIVLIFFFLIMPSLLGGLAYYLYISQPRV